MDVHVDILSADDPVLETVLHWHWREWSLGTEAERDEWRRRLRSRTGESGIPFTLLARWGGEPVGSISVCIDDVDAEFADRGPWLSGVYVLGAARDLGLGRRLLDVAARRAREAGDRTLAAHRRGGPLLRTLRLRGGASQTSLAGDAVLWRSLS